MVQNKLQLNEGKTEALLVSTSTSDKDLPTSIQIGSSVVPFVKSVRNLGVILDWRLFVLSRLDYGNCLLAGVPECLLHKLQKIQNASARLIRQEHTKPLLKALYWLPISYRITQTVLHVLQLRHCLHPSIPR